MMAGQMILQTSSCQRPPVVTKYGGILSINCIKIILITRISLFLVVLNWKALFQRKIESSFFHLNPEILTKLFNLIYYLILTSILTLNTSA